MWHQAGLRFIGFSGIWKPSPFFHGDKSTKNLTPAYNILIKQFQRPVNENSRCLEASTEAFPHGILILRIPVTTQKTLKKGRLDKVWPYL